MLSRRLVRSFWLASALWPGAVALGACSASGGASSEEPGGTVSGNAGSGSPTAGTRTETGGAATGGAGAGAGTAAAGTSSMGGTASAAGAGGSAAGSASGGAGGTGALPCPTDATFCSGFEETTLPSGAVYKVNAAPGDWTRDFELDSAVFHAGKAALRVKAGSEAGTSGSAYQML